ncbi:MAG TPA: COX15/CtaA family protein [Rubrivivax sp.]|nr:COX15/CtaA family protein [Rubrivivax sp.]
MSYAAASTTQPAPDRRLPLLRRLAWLCTALMLATISLSAFMRLSQAGLGCADWPACYGQNLRAAQPGDAAQSGHAVATVRLAHRVVASLTLLLVIVMAMATLTTRPVLKRAGALSLALLQLALALAALGIATPGARLPAVAMGNLLGGFVMLALCWRLVASTRPPATPAAAGLGAWAVAALVLLCGQLAGGALVSASYAALSCSDLTECTRSAAAAGWDWQALNPWREPVVAAAAATAPINAGSAVAINPSSAFALWAHRVGAIVVLPVLGLLGLVAWRRGRRRGGAALLMLAALQGLLGLLIVTTGLPLAAVLLHNLLAALLLATLVRLV